MKRQQSVNDDFLDVYVLCVKLNERIPTIVEGEKVLIYALGDEIIGTLVNYDISETDAMSSGIFSLRVDKRIQAVFYSPKKGDKLSIKIGDWETDCRVVDKPKYLESNNSVIANLTAHDKKKENLYSDCPVEKKESNEDGSESDEDLRDSDESESEDSESEEKNDSEDDFSAYQGYLGENDAIAGALAASVNPQEQVDPAEPFDSQ